MSKFKPIPLSNMNAEFVSRTKKPFVFTKFIYNNENGAILGRTCASWAKYVIFYAAFYGILGVFVAIQFHLLFNTIDPNFPKRQLQDSLIGTNPGLGFRPHPPEDNLASALISFKGSDSDSYKHLTDSLDNFLMVYKYSAYGQNVYACSYEQPPPPGKVCEVNPRWFGPCTSDNYYGYHTSSACVFLKLNRIFGWIPDFYNVSTELPYDMPQSLKNDIADIEQSHSSMMNTVWVSCEGENNVDTETIGAVSYYPRQGFPGYFYPYENSDGYLSPLVAVHFEHPTRGIIVNIECKAWARNIYHDRNDRLGSVHYQLLID